MNLTKATVRRGDSCVTFPIRLPYWSTQSQLNRKVLGKPKRIHFDSRLPEQVLYEADISLSYEGEHHLHPFFLNTRVNKINPEINTPPDLMRKLEEEYEYFETRWPEREIKPKLYYDDQEDHENPTWVVELPPRSAFYSSYAYLFPALGFTDHKEMMRKISGRGARTSTIAVYGFFNFDQEDSRLYRAANSVFPNVKLEKLLPVNPRTDRRIVIPVKIQLQAEFMSPFQLLSMRPVHAGAQPMAAANATTAMNALRELATEFCQRANLKQTYINVFASGSGDNPDMLTLTSVTVPDARSILKIHLRPELEVLFNLPEHTPLVFPLGQSKSYVLDTSAKRRDPFYGLYPITIYCRGMGAADSYEEGEGYVSIFGVLTEKSEREKKIESDGLVFETDNSRLSLEFKSFAQNVITFKREQTVHLSIKFHSLSN
jgi:hypothetical protein